MRIFPSQICEYIDAHAGWAHPERPEPEQASLSIVQMAFVGTLLRLLDQMPAELLTLTGRDLVDYIFAETDMRTIHEGWSEGQKYSIGRRPELGNRHPLRVVRAAVGRLRDEASPSGSTELSFILDAPLREVLLSELAYVRSALRNGEWKAATILAGSLIETLLLWALTETQNKKAASISAAQAMLRGKGVSKGRWKEPLNDWVLDDMICVCEELKIITGDTSKRASESREFRNLIHPGRTYEKNKPCTRGTAVSSVGGLELVVEDLEKWAGP